jgi:hypothetical protein
MILWLERIISQKGKLGQHVGKKVYLILTIIMDV